MSCAYTNISHFKEAFTALCVPGGLQVLHASTCCPLAGVSVRLQQRFGHGLGNDGLRNQQSSTLHSLLVLARAVSALVLEGQLPACSLALGMPSTSSPSARTTPLGKEGECWAGEDNYSVVCI